MDGRRRRITYAPLNDIQDNRDVSPSRPSTIMRLAMSDDLDYEDDAPDHTVMTIQSRPPRTSPIRYPSLPAVPEASEEGSERSSISRQSTGDTITGYDTRQEAYRGLPAPQLPTISSGEPFDWGGLHPAPEDDPFADSHLPVYHHPAPHAAAAYQAPAIVTHNNTSQSSLTDQYYMPDRTSWNLPSRPMSAYSAVTSNMTGYSYQQPPEQSQASMYPDNSNIDHFQHDTEAYASGAFSRASYRPPRSRSPTPAFEDEDYQITPDGSVQYTGYSPSPQRRQAPATNENVSPSRPRPFSQVSTSTNESDASQRRPFSQVSTNSTSTESGFRHSKTFLRAMSEPADPEKVSLANSGSTTFTEPETPLQTRHFGPAPIGRVLRRHKTKKRVQLTNGNLVLDLSVPPKLVLPRKGEPETMKTRYTAVTCDPDEFEKKGFFLRQNETKRTTELFIVITMYNVSMHHAYTRHGRALMTMFCRRMRSFSVAR